MKQPREKDKSVLIIKVGHCETLVNEEGFVPSLGDVFRHTVLLHHYKDYHVTWLTSESAGPLLQDNKYIDELKYYKPGCCQDLTSRQFDEVLCLEKSRVLCDLSKSIKADKHLGFGWNNDKTQAHPGAQSALDVANGRDSFVPIQATLFQMVNDYWNGENYVLGYKPRTTITHDIGLNFRVGSKWPSKSWPTRNWKTLESLCRRHGWSVNWQKGERDLQRYMDWINSCRLIVTCDSLGMHLGLAMKKKVIALFGPTPSEQIYMYGKGVILSAEWACPKAPCLEQECPDNGKSCMKEIKPRIVARTINNLINGD